MKEEEEELKHAALEHERQQQQEEHEGGQQWAQQQQRVTRQRRACVSCRESKTRYDEGMMCVCREESGPMASTSGRLPHAHDWTTAGHLLY